MSFFNTPILGHGILYGTGNYLFGGSGQYLGSGSWSSNSFISTADNVANAILKVLEKNKDPLDDIPDNSKELGVSNTSTYNTPYSQKNVIINRNHILYPGIIGTRKNCPWLDDYPLNVIDVNKLSYEGAQMVLNAKKVHTHTIDKISYEVVFISDEFNNGRSTYFYRIKGQKYTNIPENLTDESKINDNLVNNETVKTFINKNVYEDVIIDINIDPNLCGNRQICYLKFDFYGNDLNELYKTLYVKYNNTSGLLNKELYKFSIKNDTEKKLLSDGYIQITAYQLSNCSDKNPYIIGKFKFSDMENKINSLILYKFLNISNVYGFEFNDILVFPISIDSKYFHYNNSTDKNYITMEKNGTLINNDILKNTIYDYSLDFNYISSNTLLKRSIVIKIDNNDIWKEYYDYNCNIMLYTKNKNYVISSLLFNRLNDTLILNTDISVDKSLCDLNDVIKFSITFIGGIKENSTEKLDIKLSKQGNISNK